MGLYPGGADTMDKAAVREEGARDRRGVRGTNAAANATTTARRRHRRNMTIVAGNEKEIVEVLQVTGTDARGPTYLD